MNRLLASCLILLMLFFAACDSGPKVVEASESSVTPTQSTGVFASSEQPSASNPFTPNPVIPSGNMAEEIHKVVAKEVLPTARYVYVRVQEGEKEFWIASRKQEIALGQTYYFKKGLLKRQFESKEYKRVFEEIYLVSKLVAHDHAQHAQSNEVVNIPTHAWPEEGPLQEVPQQKSAEGILTLSALLNSPKTYEGKQIRLQGVCTKINPNILNVNWIHLDDGTAKGKDVVITSTEHFQEGEQVHVSGTVVLNKDFGAGYFYELLIENGHKINL